MGLSTKKGRHSPLHTKPTSLVADGNQAAAFPIVVLHHGGRLAPERRVPPLLDCGKANGHFSVEELLVMGGVGEGEANLERRSSPCRHGRSPGAPAAPAWPPASPIPSPSGKRKNDNNRTLRSPSGLSPRLPIISCRHSAPSPFPRRDSGGSNP